MLNNKTTDLQHKLFKREFKKVFDSLLAERGVKKTYLAEKLGYKRLSDLSHRIDLDSFKREEFAKIARILKLTDAELAELVKA